MVRSCKLAAGASNGEFAARSAACDHARAREQLLDLRRVARQIVASRVEPQVRSTGRLVSLIGAGIDVDLEEGPAANPPRGLAVGGGARHGGHDGNEPALRQ